MIWLQYLINRRLSHCHVIGYMTAPLISFRVSLCLLGDYTICRALRRRQWGLILRSPWLQESFGLSHLMWGSGFFLTSKIDKTLRPCISYRGLNQITVKNKKPLPLLTVYEQLDNANNFTKLDPRNAYHLIRIWKGDEWKTVFKTPTHLGHFEYLGIPLAWLTFPLFSRL